MKKYFLLTAVIFSLFFPSHVSASSLLFDDSFNAVDGTKLSDHNSSWSFKNYEPGTLSWGEYKIFSNMASDGDGTIYNSDRLSITLPTHFIVSERFLYSPSISSDPNLAFMDIRFPNLDETQEYGFRFYVNQPQIGNTLITFGPQSGSTTLGHYNLSTENVLSIEYDLGIFTARINGDNVLSFTNNSFSPDHLIFIQSRFVSTAKISNIQINDLSISSPTPTPSVTPSPTPTPTPTPIPSPTPFPISHFSQRDPIWKSDIYDQATKWSPANPTVERWACALTAASTVLDYYGIHQLPGGTTNNPGNLNTWLKTQSDGFIRDGAVNWNAISRVSRLASTDTIPTLEYAYKSNNPDDLHSRLNNSQPVILEEPGHFITAYQYFGDTNTTNIIDPYWTTGLNAKTTLASYGNTFLSMRTFTPSHTNLGYIMSVSDQDINSSLFRRDGSSYTEVTEASSYIQQPILDPESGLTSGEPFQILEFSKPPVGSYQLILNRDSPGFGDTEIYTYDTDGNPSLQLVTNLFSSEDIILNIEYGSTSTKIRKLVDFDTIRQDILAGRNLGLFSLPYDGSDLLDLIETADRFHPQDMKTSRSLMRLFTKVLQYRKSYMTKSLYNNLNSDTKLLLQQLF